MNKVTVSVTGCLECPLLNSNHDPFVECGHPAIEGGPEVPDWEMEKLFEHCPLKHGPLTVQIKESNES